MSGDFADMRILGRASSYDALMDILRARKDELAITFECLDAAAGTQGGYCSKILAPVPIRQIGRLSLGCILQAMGLTLLVAEDLTALKKIERQLEKRVRPVREAGHRRTGRKRWRFPKGPEHAKLMRA